MTQSDIINNNFSKAFECIKCSNAYETGAVLSEEKLFKQISERKRSTFDKSKFTIVGSPVISADGVASGFSGSNFIRVPIAMQNAWKIQMKSIFTNISDILSPLFGMSNFNHIILGTNGTITIFASEDNVTAKSLTFNDIILSIDKYYSLVFEFDGVSTYTLTAKDLNTNAEYKQSLILNSKFYNSASSWYIGSDTSRYVRGSVDLKHFSITVDGKEVFSGNKTGIDIIKPDNYTVVGNPVISADGVASGFSYNKYLTTTQTLGNSIKVFSTFKTPQSDNVTANSAIWQIKTSPTIELQVIGQKMFIINSGGTITAGNFVFEYDTWYDTIFEYNFTTGAYKLSYKKTADNNYTELTGTQSGWVNMSVSDIVIDFGTMNRYYWYTGGSIDLNAFKIYVDGNLVYQPCLKIPYTESKTGSKIVDVAHRDRVIDLYEQEGNARYFTIDEGNKNFTLPMGDIYGMIGQRSLISSTVTETNRVDIYSDKTCLICGNVATAGTINLPIELANNNYFITLSTSAKTATSFTTTATGDYILIGKVVSN